MWNLYKNPEKKDLCFDSTSSLLIESFVLVLLPRPTIIPASLQRLHEPPVNLEAEANVGMGLFKNVYGKTGGFVFKE